MKVLFDHQIFSMQTYGGISRYFANLYNELPNSQINTQLGVFYSDNYYIKNLLPGRTLLSDAILKKDARRYKWNKWYSRYLLERNDFDVFHPTYYHSYFLKSIKKPFVLTVHDMIHEIYPEIFVNDPYKDYKAQVINKADHIIAISESTKSDILKFCAIPDEKITVVHHGYHLTQNLTQGTSASEVEGPFILFVGEREGYKNFKGLLEAVGGFLVESNVKLFCAGGSSFSGEELNLINRLKLQNHVTQFSVTDSRLKELYNTAVMLVFPSLYEGFGLPILEAFENNCPVVMSNTSCFAEVGGNAAVYFDPIDPESMRTAIMNVFEDSSLRDRLRVLGQRRLRGFTFERCVNETIEVYKKCL